MIKTIKRVLGLLSNKKTNYSGQDYWVVVTEDEKNNPNRITVEISK